MSFFSTKTNSSKSENKTDNLIGLMSIKQAQLIKPDWLNVY